MVEITPFPTLTNAETSALIPKGQELDTFRHIRTYIERKSLSEPRHAEHVKLANGGDVRVVWSLIDLDHGDLNGNGVDVPIRPATKDAKTPLVISLFNSGMFEGTDAKGFEIGKANTGNSETKLAAGLFSETPKELTPNAIIFLHQEGLNAKAFEHGQRLIGHATVESLRTILSEYKKTHDLPAEKPIVFDLTGYSEGSTKIISVAAELDRQHMGKIRRIVSIGGAGFIGRTSGEKSNPFGFVADAWVRQTKEKLKPTPIGPYESGVRVGSANALLPDLNIGSEQVKTIRESLTQYPEGYNFLPVQQQGKGSERIVTKDDVRNVTHFGQRLMQTMIGTSELGSSVPWRRIKEACAYNPDVEYVSKILSKKGTKTFVYADHSDIFFSSKRVHEGVNRLRQETPDAKIWFVSSDLSHEGPHYEQTSFNWLTRTLLHAWDQRSNEVAPASVK